MTYQDENLEWSDILLNMVSGVPQFFTNFQLHIFNVHDSWFIFVKKSAQNDQELL